MILIYGKLGFADTLGCQFAVMLVGLAGREQDGCSGPHFEFSKHSQSNVPWITQLLAPPVRAHQVGPGYWLTQTSRSQYASKRYWT